VLWILNPDTRVLPEPAQRRRAGRHRRRPRRDGPPGRLPRLRRHERVDRAEPEVRRVGPTRTRLHLRPFHPSPRPPGVEPVGGLCEDYFLFYERPTSRSRPDRGHRDGGSAGPSGGSPRGPLDR
jgi:hypothetical protein